MSLRNFSLNFGGVTRQENTLGVSPAVLAEIVKQHGEHSELQQKEIARLADALELKNGQMRAAPGDFESGGYSSREIRRQAHRDRRAFDDASHVDGR